ncbi:type I pantothenate kinase [Ectobacillus antri]|jgi:type I pantothenate kinase|uniref:Pantothenate kinase n=1 Tax=Ectobacillus antri TaxID=2486280 RepID=A0ABT6H0G1_9BACI|nr:type I pantothenate kinase [Ectobacillus antri]MDG4656012.1 type I pantothenate kinase [Ectobacillus antri]MDG5752687.1 type I pantothenate kinase [Ectobacillus antri]
MHGNTSYIEFSREQWAQLQQAPCELTERELMELQGLNESLSMREVTDVYLPLTRLLNLYVEASQQLHRNVSTFLENRTKKVPYIIGIAGSVAVGKSTTARLLQKLLARFESHPRVDLVTTDGFLYPNRILEERQIMNKKGFPESYDTKNLIDFISAIKSGEKAVAPVYSHLEYDILPGDGQVIDRPDILIVEGINVLQVSPSHQIFVSDFFDFSIYVDACEQNIERWYIERFFMLQKTAFQNSNSYFHRYVNLSKEDTLQLAQRIWREINAKNLRENILPTRSRAQSILYKGENHNITKISLRKL